MFFARRMRMYTAVLLTIAMLLAAGQAYAAPTATPVPSLPPFDETVAEYNEEDPGALMLDQLYAQSAIVINQDTGDVLLQKNADMRMNPASTTKIMTALLALEYGNLNSVVTIPPEAAMIPEDSSKVPVTVGEEMTFIDLLYGFMLKSGNDAGNAIAVIIAGSIDSFVDMMNDRAAELGCTDTHFVNPHGYTAEGHYTTARDMALITRAAMQHSTFQKIVSSGQYTMNQSSMRGEMVIHNSNMMVVYGSEYRYRYATGVKTGTTSAAGQCLVGSATKDGINLISVAFKSTVAFPQAKWQDTERMMEYGFAQYATYDFYTLYDLMNVVVPISGAAADDPSGGMVGLDAMMNRVGSYQKTILKKDLDKLLADFESRVTIEYTGELTAPVEHGDILGRLTFTPETGDAITAVLVADRTVAAAPVIKSSVPLTERILNAIPDGLLIIAACFLLCLLVVIVARMVLAARRRKRARERARARARARAAAQARARAQGRPVQRTGRPPVRR